MTDVIEITRVRHFRLLGGLFLAFVAVFAYPLWYVQMGWPWVLLWCSFLIAFGAVGITMLIRNPHVVLWFERDSLHWHEDSCVPFQRGWKGSIPVSDITNVRSTRRELTEGYFYELAFITADGKLHKMPPNISNETLKQQLAHLLATLRAHKPSITFEEIHLA
jgi:hypothetical protein